MKETTWIIDSQSGELTVEGLQQSELIRLAADFLLPGKSVNCACPIGIQSLRNSSAYFTNGEPSLRVFRIYHNSVVEGPGRRSVLQTAGCNLRCPGCHVPETHDPQGGIEMQVGGIVPLLLASEGEPRDGVTILGGEPFLQPNGLLALLQILKRRGQHITLYTGHTLEQLTARPESVIKQILAFTDILIDGPFAKELSDNAGEWRGSTNQRIIYSPALHYSTNTPTTYYSS
jgi:anaerobic ribonucleoside-triphosphate reductase activating protein